MSTVAEVRPVPGYTLLEHVGTGRTAEVFHALNPEGKDVSIKLPKVEILAVEVLAKMFANEVMLYRSLDHERICTFYSGQPTGPHPHVVMRHYPETDLENNDVPEPTLLQILLDASVALEYLHGRKLVHQDIKPANIFIDQGRGFLADFGAAANEMQPGMIAGSPFYMAPEMVRGERGSNKSDVYSMGVLAYERLTGAKPFDGETLEEVMSAHLAKVPFPIRKIRKDLPRELELLVDRSVAKDPSTRPSITDWKNTLMRVLQPGDTAPLAPKTPETAATPPQPAPSRRIEASASRAKDPPSLLGRLFGKKR